jgi:quinol monooxygenase YgiN
MTTDLPWVVELSLQPGHNAEFTALMSEMIAATRNEAGTLSHEWSTSADGVVPHL